MYGQVKVTGVAALTTASATFVDITGAILRFNSEEEEMLTTLDFTGAVSHSAPDRVDVQLVVDGAVIDADFVNGQAGVNPGLADAVDMLTAKAVVRLSKGQHVVKAQWKTPAATASLHVNLFPAVLSAYRLSADAVLAHGVDSKVQSIY